MSSRIRVVGIGCHPGQLTAEAREAIWTPEKEKAETPTKLWTPGTKETA